MFSILCRSCWLDLAEYCLSSSAHSAPGSDVSLHNGMIPEWHEVTAHALEAVADGEAAQVYLERLQVAKVMYDSFLAHVYLELHQGEQAMQVHEAPLKNNYTATRHCNY